jgi:hypothetical protein
MNPINVNQTMSSRKPFLSKNSALWIIALFYLAAMLYTSLYVPVKATLFMHDGEVYEEYGYYPLWGISIEDDTNHRDENIRNLTVGINTTAWAIQYAFITLAFLSITFRTLRYYKNLKKD